MTCFEDFCKKFVQSINLRNSKIYFRKNLHDKIKKWISKATDFSRCVGKSKYLGIYIDLISLMALIVSQF